MGARQLYVARGCASMTPATKVLSFSVLSGSVQSLTTSTRHRTTQNLSSLLRSSFKEGKEDRRLEWLHEHLRPLTLGSRLEIMRSECRHQDHASVRRYHANRLQCFDAGQSWHSHVHDDAVDRILTGDRHGFESVIRSQSVPAAQLQDVAQRVYDVAIVIDNEHCFV